MKLEHCARTCKKIPRRFYHRNRSNEAIEVGNPVKTRPETRTQNIILLRHVWFCQRGYVLQQTFLVSSLTIDTPRCMLVSFSSCLELSVCLFSNVSEVIQLVIHLKKRKNYCKNNRIFCKICAESYIFWSKSRYFFRLVDFFRPSSGLGGIYNVHFRAFQTFSFRAKKKLEIKKMFCNISPTILKKCYQFSTLRFGR